MDGAVEAPWGISVRAEGVAYGYRNNDTHGRAAPARCPGRIEVGCARAPQRGRVTVKDGIVTLTGWVDHYTKKWAAEDAAHRVHSVKAVANDIEVRLPSSAERIDADIAAAATRALEWDAFVPIEKLDVTVSKG